MHLLVIFGIALLVFGPKGFRNLGRGSEAIRSFKQACTGRNKRPRRASSRHRPQVQNGRPRLAYNLSTLFFCNLGINHILAGSSSIRKGGGSRFFTIFGGSRPVRGKPLTGRTVV
jgi:TatA/E family protein of Tat protein translocase